MSRPVDFPLAPRRTALVNVDLQRCFVEGTPLAAADGLAVLHRVNRLTEAFRDAGALVVHTRTQVRADGADLGVAKELVPAAILALYTQGAPTAELHPDLVVKDQDVVLDKPRYGAFHGTGLDRLLRSRHIEAVVVTGIATNVCADTTAREAAQHDYRVFFVADATATRDTAGVTARDLQRATCASLGTVFAQITTVDAMLEKLRSATWT